jgi:hypothetical protein
MTNFLIILSFIVFVYACILVTNCVSTTDIGENKTTVIEKNMTSNKQEVEIGSKKYTDSSSISIKDAITKTTSIAPESVKDKDKITTNTYNSIREDNIEFY